jgi:hypothetical protein
MKDTLIKFVNDHSFNPVDGGALGVGILGILKYLPEISAGLSAVWVLLRIFILLRDEVFGRKKGTEDGDK